MRRKVLKTIGSLMIVATLVSVFSLPVFSGPRAGGDSGTCCVDNTNACIVGSTTLYGYYLKKGGGQCDEAVF